MMTCGDFKHLSVACCEPCHDRRASSGEMMVEIYGPYGHPGESGACLLSSPCEQHECVYMPTPPTPPAGEVAP